MDTIETETTTTTTTTTTGGGRRSSSSSPTTTTSGKSYCSEEQKISLDNTNKCNSGESGSGRPKAKSTPLVTSISKHKHTKSAPQLRAQHHNSYTTSCSSTNNSYNKRRHTTSNNIRVPRTKTKFNLYNHRGRFQINERVLVRLTSTTKDTNTNPIIPNMVNASGYPMRAPAFSSSSYKVKKEYCYVLCEVRKVHFDEHAPYFTVQRMDDWTCLRANADCMLTIKGKGAVAALKAADSMTPSSFSHGGYCNPDHRHHGIIAEIEMEENMNMNGNYCEQFPKIMKRCTNFIKRQATLVLHGDAPYTCSLRLSWVNVLALCSFWFMLADQARLAIFPVSFEYTAIVVSAIVWFVLVLELAFEVWIWPRGYFRILKSEIAFDPNTARYLSLLHLIVELTALLLFVTEFVCLFEQSQLDDIHDCIASLKISLSKASIMTVLGPTRKDTMLGHLFFFSIRLRIFGPIRRWTKMWIKSEFISRKRGMPIPGDILRWQPMATTRGHEEREDGSSTVECYGDEGDTSMSHDNRRRGRSSASELDSNLMDASHIGTALMVINSYRVALLLIFIVGMLPLIYTIYPNGGANNMNNNMVKLLNANNIAAPTGSVDDCTYLELTLRSFMDASAFGVKDHFHKKVIDYPYLLWMRMLPVRCAFQGPDGVITASICRMDGNKANLAHYDTINQRLCPIWSQGNEYTTRTNLGNQIDINPANIVTYTSSQPIFIDSAIEEYSVSAMINEINTVAMMNFTSFILQIILLVFILAALSVLNGDQVKLVLRPLRRMLRIAVSYATNPLNPTMKAKSKVGTISQHSKSKLEEASDADDGLGKFETDQLVNAFTKITNLMQQCWGVAGADIISTSLDLDAPTKTVAFDQLKSGKCVYAIFAFAAIADFKQLSRKLGRDIMILINNVASVLHEEIYRWGFGKSGQVNRNLGSSFFMVFRIGSQDDVQQRLLEATEVIFKCSKSHSSRRSCHRLQSSSALGDITNTTKNNEISLASLPGISMFTDKSLISMLKTFSGLHRDKGIMKWKNDARLLDGIESRPYSLEIMFGLDAGWAIEGAVGSDDKIDATYLSPHVNMASRMMSACEQYGVTLLVSEAYAMLLSDTAQSKLRHIDTVTVKGSTIEQRLFTYDARHEGVNFFLLERSGDQVAHDNYAPGIWNSDLDLLACRQHITPEFEVQFQTGLQQYLQGNWSTAMRTLENANALMIQFYIQEGHVEGLAQELYERVANMEEIDPQIILNIQHQQHDQQLGDGPCQCLIAFMESCGGAPPDDWVGFRHLTQK